MHDLQVVHPGAAAISSAIWFHVGASSLVIVKASPIASARSSSPVNPTAKSRLWVSVHRLLPSPVMITGLPARIRATAVHPPDRGSFVSSYVCDVRMIVTGKSCSR